MVNLLKSIFNILPSAQRNAINSLIETRKKTVSKRLEAQTANEIANKYIARVSSSPFLNPIYFQEGDKLSSNSHNENFQSIFLDLSSIYDSISYVNNTLSIQKTALESEYLKSRASINKLLSDIKAYSLRKKYPDFNEIKVIDFNNSTNSSKETPNAVVSDTVRLLQLPIINSNKAHDINRASRSTKIYTRTYSTGLKGTLDSSFPPENMVDKHLHTFWGQLVMANSPVTQKFPVSYLQDSVTVNGPVVEIYLEFSHVERINTIRLLPFSSQKLKILDLSYVSSKESDQYRSINGFKPEESLDWVEYNFSPVFCKTLKVTLAQENYTLQTYSIPKNIVRNTDIYSKLFEGRAANIIYSGGLSSIETLTLTQLLNPFEETLQSLSELITYKDINFNNYLSAFIYTKSLDLFKTYYELFNSTELVDIKKYEYVFGVREIEVLDNVYAPFGIYQSPKFDVNATVSEISIEVEEEQASVQTSWEDNYQKTSTEWSVDFGEGRLLPIHPRNLTGELANIPVAKDERLFVSRFNMQGLTRLGSYYSTPLRVKQDGQVIDPNLYATERITGSIPYLKVTLSGDSFNPNSIYTIDYAVSPDSYRVSILENFVSRSLSSPEVFTELGPDKDITTSKFPFIDYAVVNSPYFSGNSSEAVWNYVPPQANIVSGQIRIYPTVVNSAGTVLQTGNVTGYCISGQWGDRSGESFVNFGSDPNISSSYFSPVSGYDFGYYLKIMNYPTYPKVNGFNSSITGFTFENPVTIPVTAILNWEAEASGQVFIGSISATGASGYLEVDYILGVGLTSDTTTYAFENSTYEPIKITVGGTVAKNITNYETLEHPAFSTANINDVSYEYIQAGKKIYFNQQISDSIEVSYNWLHEDISIRCILRSNEPVTPRLTPKVNSINVLMNNFVI